MDEIQRNKCFGNTKKQLTFLKLLTSGLKIVCTKAPQKVLCKMIGNEETEIKKCFGIKNSNNSTNDQNATEH